MPDDEGPSKEKSSAEEQTERQARAAAGAMARSISINNDVLAAIQKSTPNNNALLAQIALNAMPKIPGIDFSRFTPGLIASINSQLAASMAMPKIDIWPSYLTAIENIDRVLAASPTLSRASYFATPDPPKSAYSPQMESPASYFGPYEVEINSFDDLHREITNLIKKNPDLPLVWRGVRRETWGLHSGLYRRLMKDNGVVPPEKKPKGDQPFPDEDQMVEAEREILRLARDDWRFDDMSALETFARIQHAGGPTRLIDVTMNPYVAAWFAVEAAPTDDDHDARLFAIATRPVPKADKPPASESTIRLDELGSLRDPFWHLLETPADRQQLDWGTGSRRRLWKPPAYDPRISAQNAAFILDGVPITSMKTAPYFKIKGSVYWRRADLLASGSIYAKLHSPTRKAAYNAPNFAPTFSFKIAADKKAEIRDYLESRFGYRRSYIYPDMAALAEHLKTLPLTAKG